MREFHASALREEFGSEVAGWADAGGPIRNAIGLLARHVQHLLQRPDVSHGS